jgi:hypothetical protein
MKPDQFLQGFFPLHGNNDLQPFTPLRQREGVLGLFKRKMSSHQ